MLVLTRTMGSLTRLTDTTTGTEILIKIGLIKAGAAGRSVQLMFDAPKHVVIMRDEAINRGNVATQEE